MILTSALVLMTIVSALTMGVMVNERRQVAKGQVCREPLSSKEEALIIGLCVLNPVMGGAILYYGWRKPLPEKAKQANSISLWAFLVSMTISIIALWAFPAV